MARDDAMARRNSMTPNGAMTPKGTMNCREVMELLPLWIGQDLPDSTSADGVARHLEKCPSCERRRIGLQASLEALQSSTAETFSSESSRHTVWPKLVSRIADWERNHRRERFNGWVPASVMALAVALMVAVSIPSIQDEVFGNGANLTNTVDLFQHDSSFLLDERSPLNQDSNQALPGQRPAVGTTVNWKLDQW